MKVSFDFDGCLSRKDVQDFARELIKIGVEVWIVTSRHSDESARSKAWWWIIDQNKNLYNIANECGIKKENIHFTDGKDKSLFLKDKGFLFHLDDDEIELLKIIKTGDPCKPMNADHFEWKESCLELINKK